MGLFFESADVRCAKNVQRFLWFRWLGHHKLKVVWVKRWGPISWHDYEVEWECALCGARLRRFGISHAEMLQAGFEPAQLTGKWRRGKGRPHRHYHNL